ncbi:MAG: class I SAM-dependent methyltransferase [SAR202 cluster bacterium]|nr:class I SAM-dependent methyltransferase [SAR202 cluster bacterium]|tara:strand:+ start:5258 stop:5833 length:576 start_codon:yes stop_codon:yes gene_type:complete
MSPKSSVKNVQALLHPTLEESYDPQSMIALVPIHNDNIVADIGSGPGWLSIPLAKYVYAGKCYAIDVQKDMLKHVKNQAEEAKLKNIETLVSKENSIPLEDNSIDGVALSDVLNEASRPKTLIKEATRLLKKSGWISIVDWLPAEGKSEVGPAASRRVDQQEIRETLESLGLTTLTSRQLTPHRYIIVARK